MGWLKAGLLILSRFFKELDRYRAQAKRQRREDRLNETRDNPNEVNSQLFGPNSGRVRISRDTAEKPANMPTDTTPP